MRVAGLARIKLFRSFSDDSITSQCMSSKKNTGLVKQANNVMSCMYCLILRRGLCTAVLSLYMYFVHVPGRVHDVCIPSGL